MIKTEPRKVSHRGDGKQQKENPYSIKAKLSHYFDADKCKDKRA